MSKSKAMSGEVNLKIVDMSDETVKRATMCIQTNRDSRMTNTCQI